MRKTRHYLWWTPCCLALLVVGCATLSKNQARGPVCALHSVPLRVGVAPIRYGFPAIDVDYEKRKEKEFPNSNSHVLGGCGLGWKQVEVVAYCPKCRETDPIAQIRVTGDGALAHAHDVGAIEIEVLFVQYSASVVEEALRGGELDAGTLIRLMRQGKGSVLCAPRVITPSGSEGDVKSTTEFRFPVAYRQAQAEATTNRIASGDFALTPADFETREVGVQMSALPELSEDGLSIAGAVSCEYVFPPDWRTNEIAVSAEGGTTLTISYQEPYFHTISLPGTSVRVPVGQTVLLAGGLPAKDKGNVVYLLLSARNARIPQKEEGASNQSVQSTR